MVMKVGNIQSVFFRGKTDTKKDVQSNVTYPQIRELSCITPDFSVKLPQQYTKLPTVELDNGLKIHQYMHLVHIQHLKQEQIYKS